MNKKVITGLLVIGLAVVAIAGGTLAWFTWQVNVDDNVFTAGTVKIEASEKVTAGDVVVGNWNPGDCVDKEFTIENIGSKKVKIRGVINTQWYEEVGGDWEEWEPDGDDAATVALKELTPAQDWTLGEDGYWYYNLDLAGTYGAGEPVEFDSAKLTLRVCLNGALADNQYQGKKFILSATFQAIQASHESVDGSGGWDWSVFDNPEPEEP